MPKRVSIDDALLDAAFRIGGHRTKRETVNEALEEYIKRRKRQRALALIGKVEFVPGYDYKRARQRR